MVDKIPVIFDTDIGTDIDDTWALGLLLRSPELDPRLITTATGDTEYRACIVAKFLEITDRTEIPIGIGLSEYDEFKPQAQWVMDYDLTNFPGKLHQDGVNAIIETILSSEELITVIAAGPLTNIAAALKQKPEIAEKARFIGMHGSIRSGYNGNSGNVAEYNVFRNVSACQTVFNAPWNITITPLDTCGVVKLKGEKYNQIKECKEILTKAIIENYEIWSSNGQFKKSLVIPKETSALYDTVAIYLAISEELLNIEELGIRITDEGKMVIDETAKKIRCATSWKELSAFEDLLVSRLIGN